MKTAVKLILIYFLLQLAGMFTAMPCAMLYLYLTQGVLDAALVTECSLAPTMLFGFLYMGLYLKSKGYLTDDGLMYRPLTSGYLLWSLLAGAACIYIVSCLMSWLTFLPNWMEQTFDVLQAGWLGVLCLTLLGPVLEELLFRGAVTKVLLQRYHPGTAILLSGLLFGLFHINPVQVVGACLIGFLLAWIYYQTGSLIPCILIHVLNNGFSEFMNWAYPEVDELTTLLSPAALWSGLLLMLLLLGIALKKMNRKRLMV